MKRLPDWRQRLGEYVAGIAKTPFAPGSADCALFAADAILAMTGTDPAAGFRGRYKTLKGGFKRLQKAGYADLAALVAAHLAEIPVAMAQVGDIAILSADGEAALGVVQGDRIYVRSLGGLATVPLLSAERMFRL